MPLFRSKTKVIDAEQFIDPADPCRGVHLHDSDGTYYVVTVQGQNH